MKTRDSALSQLKALEKLCLGTGIDEHPDSHGKVEACEQACNSVLGAESGSGQDGEIMAATLWPAVFRARRAALRSSVAALILGPGLLDREGWSRSDSCAESDNQEKYFRQTVASGNAGSLAGSDYFRHGLTLGHFVKEGLNAEIMGLSEDHMNRIINGSILERAAFRPFLSRMMEKDFLAEAAGWLETFQYHENDMVLRYILPVAAVILKRAGYDGQMESIADVEPAMQWIESRPARNWTLEQDKVRPAGTPHA
ncbi:MAG: hypothetical protein M3O22_01475 [Pseudomonadota bacterium]|nr:hypothetical protein [Pseudomonadota bacterium]